MPMIKNLFTAFMSFLCAISNCQVSETSLKNLFNSCLMCNERNYHRIQITFVNLSKAYLTYFFGHPLHLQYNREKKSEMLLNDGVMSLVGVFN